MNQRAGIVCLSVLRRCSFVWVLFVTGLHAADPAGAALPRWRVRAEYVPVVARNAPPVVVVWDYNVTEIVREAGLLWWRVRADDPGKHALVRCEFLFAPETRQIRDVVASEWRLGVWVTRDLPWSTSSPFWRDDLVIPLVTVGPSGDRVRGALCANLEDGFPLEVERLVAGDRYLRRYYGTRVLVQRRDEKDPSIVSSGQPATVISDEKWTFTPEGKKVPELEVTWEADAFWWSDFRTPRCHAVRLDVEKN